MTVFKPKRSRSPNLSPAQYGPGFVSAFNGPAKGSWGLSPEVISEALIMGDWQCGPESWSVRRDKLLDRGKNHNGQ
jgi:hypothetical protein